MIERLRVPRILRGLGPEIRQRLVVLEIVKVIESGIARRILPRAIHRRKQQQKKDPALPHQLNRPSAHRACSATTASWSAAICSSALRNRASPLFPIAIATFLRNPEYFGRASGLFRNISRNSSSVKPASSSRSGAALALSKASVVGARQFHGHTSWQTSHPNT